MENKLFFERMQHIIDLFNKQTEEADLRGENYNVFNVLGLSTNETRLHSAFIVNLLNQREKHGLKTFPLLEFLKITRFPYLDFITEEDIKNAEVTCEHYIGPINDEYTEGGFIDILIRIKEFIIVIENKIDARDQKHQLLRYKNFCKAKKHQLLYLTLDGHLPADDSCQGLEEGKDYFCISYGDEITKWLKQCLVAALDKPLIRETLQQYINILNQLTNNIMDKTDLNRLYTIMSEYPDVVHAISCNLQGYRQYLVEAYLISPMKDWCKKNGFEWYEDEGFLNDSKWKGFGIYRSGWNKMIAIEFDKSEFKTPYWGVWKWKTQDTVQNKGVGEKTNENWPYGWQYSKYEAYDEKVAKDFIDGKIFAEVRDGFMSILKTVENNPASFNMN